VAAYCCLLAGRNREAGDWLLEKAPSLPGMSTSVGKCARTRCGCAHLWLLCIIFRVIQSEANAWASSPHHHCPGWARKWERAQVGLHDQLITAGAQADNDTPYNWPSGDVPSLSAHPCHVPPNSEYLVLLKTSYIQTLTYTRELEGPLTLPARLSQSIVIRTCIY
jgi:hypothetical protein